jgi:hypothetical protein
MTEDGVEHSTKYVIPICIYLFVVYLMTVSALTLYVLHTVVG